METELPSRADVVIVGGGIAGASSCFFMAERTDCSVLLLEKDAIASGSTGDSSAIIRHHYGSKRIYAEMARWSHEFYRQFEERTGEPLAYEPNPLVRLGVEGDWSGEYALSGYETLSSLDIPVRRLDAESLREEFPMLSLSAVDFGVADETAAYSDAADAAMGFSRAAQARGATVATGTAVTDIEADDGAVTAVRTDRGRVETDDLVVTAGPWTDPLMSSVGVDVPLEPSREQVLLLSLPERFRAKYPEGIPTTSPPGADWYVRDDFSGGALIATHHSANDADPDAYSQTPDESVKLRLIDELTEFCPGLVDAELRGEYCGIYSNTPDYDFIIDQVGPEGCYVACGFSGHGFKHGPAVGRMVSDLVRDGETDLVDVDYFSLDRFEANSRGHGKPAESA
jgi:monomeric sarcosine oxidase